MKSCNLKFYILKRCRPIKRTGICHLCLNEKLFIIEHQGNDLLNQRNKLISKCRHKNKFKLMKHKTWPLCGKCPCLGLFSGAIFFPAFGLNMETYRVRVSPCTHSECGIIRARSPPMWTLFTHLKTEVCFIILIPLYCKFTVVSWLNDCEDRKLVVPTHVLFY